jgi:hypothetical protein
MPKQAGSLFWDSLGFMAEYGHMAKCGHTVVHLGVDLSAPQRLCTLGRSFLRLFRVVEVGDDMMAGECAGSAG